MSGKIKLLPISRRAILFAANQLGVDASALTVEPVSGGFSLNQRALVRHGSKSLFVKEVEDSLLQGDGRQERSWLAKDHGVMELLRSQDINVVPEWSALSDDSAILSMTAYSAAEGWHWSLPDDSSIQHSYINAVIAAVNRLEEVPVSSDEVQRLGLQPYFREIIGNVSLFSSFVSERDNLNRLTQKYQLLAQASEMKPNRSKLQRVLDVIHNPVALTKIRHGIEELLGQPDEVFGHCDVRSDNLAYDPAQDKLVLVDWNWASQTPKNFGSTEFLISVAGQGADVTAWHDELNRGLLAGLVGLWWQSSLGPEIREGSGLRDHQAVSAAIAYDLLARIS